MRKTYKRICPSHVRRRFYYLWNNNDQARLQFTLNQNRRVRMMLPAKIPNGKVDKNGNLLFDLKWDHLHQMSLDFALHAFQQYDDMINKQRDAATRNVHSCLDNNPNLAEHKSQFVFVFMREEQEDQTVEVISETPVKPR